MEVIKREFLDKPSVSPNGHAERSRPCRQGVKHFVQDDTTASAKLTSTSVEGLKGSSWTSQASVLTDMPSETINNSQSAAVDNG